MAAAFPALTDDGVAAGLLGLHRVLHRATNHHDLQARRLQPRDDRQRHAQPGDEGRGAFRDDHLDAGGQGVGRGRQKIDAERLVGQFPDLAHLVANEVGRRPGHAQHAVAAGVRHRRRQRRVGHPAHAG